MMDVATARAKRFTDYKYVPEGVIVSRLDLFGDVLKQFNVVWG